MNSGVPRNSLLLSSHVPRNYAPCSLDPQTYSSLFSTISLLFHFRLLERGYPATILRKYFTYWGENFDRKTALWQRTKCARTKILPFVTQYHSALPRLKRILMGEMAPYTKPTTAERNLKKPPLICYRKGKSLKDRLVSLLSEVWSAGDVWCPSLIFKPYFSLFSPARLRRTKYMICSQGPKITEIVIP